MFRKHLSSNLFFLYIFGMAVTRSLFFPVIDLLGDWCLFEYLLFCFFRNRKACWRRRRELCFMAFLHSNRCRSKSCFLVGFTKKYSFGWSFWCCFWVIYYQCPCKGTWNCILEFICCLRYSKFLWFYFYLMQMSWDWRKILEVLILGQFVIEKVGAWATNNYTAYFPKLATCYNELKTFSRFISLCQKL